MDKVLSSQDELYNEAKQCLEACATLRSALQEEQVSIQGYQHYVLGPAVLFLVEEKEERKI